MVELSEEQEQMLVVEYLEIKGHKFTAIPNSTFTTSWNQKRKNKATGLRPGLPDLLICMPKKLLFIEMKKKKVKKASTLQQEWIDELNKYPSVDAHLCSGFENAIEVIKKYEI